MRMFGGFGGVVVFALEMGRSARDFDGDARVLICALWSSGEVGTTRVSDRATRAAKKIRNSGTIVFEKDWKHSVANERD